MSQEHSLRRLQHSIHPIDSTLSEVLVVVNRFDKERLLTMVNVMSFLSDNLSADMNHGEKMFLKDFAAYVMKAKSVESFDESLYYRYGNSSESLFSFVEADGCKLQGTFDIGDLQSLSGRTVGITAAKVTKVGPTLANGRPTGYALEKIGGMVTSRVFEGTALEGPNPIFKILSHGSPEAETDNHGIPHFAEKGTFYTFSLMGDGAPKIFASGIHLSKVIGSDFVSVQVKVLALNVEVLQSLSA